MSLDVYTFMSMALRATSRPCRRPISHKKVLPQPGARAGRGARDAAHGAIDVIVRERRGAINVDIGERCGGTEAKNDEIPKS